MAEAQKERSRKMERCHYSCKEREENGWDCDFTFFAFHSLVFPHWAHNSPIPNYFVIFKSELSFNNTVIYQLPSVAIYSLNAANFTTKPTGSRFVSLLQRGAETGVRGARTGGCEGACNTLTKSGRETRGEWGQCRGLCVNKWHWSFKCCFDISWSEAE